MASLLDSTEQRAADIASTLQQFILPGQWVEIRGISFPGSSRARAQHFGYDHLHEAAKLALDWEAEEPLGIYFTINPLGESVKGSQAFVKDEHVLFRQWVLIDIDPVRAKELPSCEEEKAAAAWVASGVIEHLEAVGNISGFVKADSGNGYHILFPVEMPNCPDSREQVKALLYGLDKRFSTDKAKVDKSVHNASRITKLYGTLSRKGEVSQSRPHRVSSIFEAAPRTDEQARINTAGIERLLSQWSIEDKAAGRIIDPMQPIDRAREWLKQREPAVAGQEGHNWTYCTCCDLVEKFDLSESEIVEAVQIWNQSCQPPWSIQDLRHKAKEAVEKAAGARGQFLENGQSSSGGAGAASTSGKTEWTEPIPLSKLPEPIPFPVEVLPEAVKNIIEEVAFATGTSSDYAAGAALAVMSGALGTAVQLKVKQHYSETACIYMSLVGSPGTAKSPVMSIMARPIFELEDENHELYRLAVEDWADGPLDGRPEKPKIRRLLVDNATTESLTLIMANNPRGLFMHRDELAALMTGMDQYKPGGKGSDRQFYLSCYSGKKIMVDRKSQEDGIPIYVRHPYLTIVGAIQPDIVESICGKSAYSPNDGFMDRFLHVYPKDVDLGYEQFREVSDQAMEFWGDVVKRIYDISMVEGEHGPHSHYVALSPDARSAWTDVTQRFAEDYNASEYPPSIQSGLIKLRASILRFALILHCAHLTANAPFTQVSAATIYDAEKVAKYFQVMLFRISALLQADKQQSLTFKVLAKLQDLVKQDTFTVTRRDLYRSLRRSIPDMMELERHLSQLEDFGYIRSDPMPRNNARCTPVYNLNPLITNLPW